MSRHVLSYVGTTALVGSLSLALAGVAGGHGEGTQVAGGVAVDPTSVVVGTAAVCLLGGIATVYWWPPIFEGSVPTHSLLGGLLVVLGGSVVLPALVARPAPALVGVLAAGLLVRGVQGRSADTRHRRADVAASAVLSHRVLEGLLVAGIYAADSAVGLVGALVLTGHALVETVVVGRAYAETSVVRALLAVFLLQVGYVAGASGGTYLAMHVPPVLSETLVALTGGVLVGVGLVELRA
jgi:zinc transporter ZupT